MLVAHHSTVGCCTPTYGRSAAVATRCRNTHREQGPPSLRTVSPWKRRAPKPGRRGHGGLLGDTGTAGAASTARPPRKKPAEGGGIAVAAAAAVATSRAAAAAAVDTPLLIDLPTSPLPPPHHSAPHHPPPPCPVPGSGLKLGTRARPPWPRVPTPAASGWTCP